jgi:F0F1-type ATP synthase epsilon subunit
MQAFPISFGMRARILSLKGIEYEGDVESFNVGTKIGEITILDDHHPLITILKPCKAHLVTLNDGSKDFIINSGFLEMNTNNELTVLVS